MLLLMVVIGYFITFVTLSSQERSSLTAQELILGISFGVIYLLLALFSHVLFARVLAGWAGVR